MRKQAKQQASSLSMSNKRIKDVAINIMEMRKKEKVINILENDANTRHLFYSTNMLHLLLVGKVKCVR